MKTLVDFIFEELGAFDMLNEEKDKNDFVPRKFKDVENRVKKVAKLDGDRYSISHVDSDTRYSAQIIFKNDSYTKTRGNVVIDVKAFQKYAEELRKSGADDYEEKLKQNGLLYNQLIPTDGGLYSKSKLHELKNANVLVPFTMTFKCKDKDASKEDDAKYDEIWRATKSTGGIKFYDPENDVFYCISAGNASKVKTYDIDDFPIDLEFESETYQKTYDGLMEAMSKLINAINPNSKFIRKDLI